MNQNFKYVVVAIVSCFVSILTWETLHIVSGVDNTPESKVSNTR